MHSSTINKSAGKNRSAQSVSTAAGRPLKERSAERAARAGLDRSIIKIGISLWVLVLLSFAALFWIKQYQSDNAISSALSKTPVLPLPKKSSFSRPVYRRYNNLYDVEKNGEGVRMNNGTDLQQILNNRPAGFERPYRTN